MARHWILLPEPAASAFITLLAIVVFLFLTDQVLGLYHDVREFYYAAHDHPAAARAASPLRVVDLKNREWTPGASSTPPKPAEEARPHPPPPPPPPPPPHPPPPPPPPPPPLPRYLPTYPPTHPPTHLPTSLPTYRPPHPP